MLRNWHDQHAGDLSVSERFAESLTRAIGSDASLIIHSLVFFAFLISPVFRLWSWAIMLLVFTTSVSIEAIYLCIFLQRSSNTHGDRDKSQADEDFKTNRESKDDIELVQKNLYRLESEKIDAMHVDIKKILAAQATISKEQ